MRVTRQTIRLALTGLMLFVLIPIAALNVEEWAKERKWDRLLADYWGPAMRWLSDLGDAGWFLFLAGSVAGATVTMWLDYLLRHRTATGAPISPATHRASLKLWFRPNQDPLEIANTNVWRWFAFKNISVAPNTRQASVLQSQIFVTFDGPINPLYRTATCNKPDVALNVIDLSARAAVISAHGRDLDDLIVELEFSDAPI